MPAKKDLADYIFTTKYARYVPEKARRETFDEAVDRVRDMMLRKYPHCEEEIRHAYDRKMRSKKVIGSQRVLQYGGVPVERNNARGFNCCYSFCDRLRFFQETFWLLLCGCGVGFSVQRHHVAGLPGFTKTRREGGDLEPKVFVVEDSIEGWADALGVLLSSYFEDPVFPEYADCLVGLDFSNVRPKGAPISSGGKAPGPEPLITALDKIAAVLDVALADGQDKLTPIQAFDIVMHSADAVLSGGTRRSATIALFSDDDQEMMTAKTGNWFAENPQRARANISALRLRDQTSFETYYASLMHARQWGEPGDYWADSTEIGPNPCVEACFWPQIEIDGVLHTGWQFCNLGSINVAAVETVEEFYEECETTAMVCTFQAGFNKYDYLGHVSEAITNREALILVSMTGIMDRADVVLKPEVLEQGARIVKEANERLAHKIGINSSSRTTGIKPEGTGSLLLGTLAAGRHGWPFKRGIRHVQANKTENVLNFFKMYNPHAIEHSVWSTNGVDDVVLFPIEAPEGAVLEREMTAIESLEQVKMLQVHWVNAGRRPELCTQPYLQNSVSNTIKVGDDEWDDVADYIYDNREYFTGVALLGRSGDKDFRQAPNVSVPTDEEILEIYGEPLTVLSQELMAAVEPGSEWDAIAYFGGDESVKPSSEWVSLRTYLDEWLELAGVDVRRAVYCMKDVYYNEKYKNLVANWTPVPYDLMVELDDTTAFTGESACAGGACTI